MGVKGLRGIMGLAEKPSEVGQADGPSEWLATCEAEERCAVGRLHKYSAGGVACHGCIGAQWATHPWDAYPLAM